jgi:phage gp36-like protein
MKLPYLTSRYLLPFKRLQEALTRHYCRHHLSSTLLRWVLEGSQLLQTNTYGCM